MDVAQPCENSVFTRRRTAGTPAAESRERNCVRNRRYAIARRLRSTTIIIVGGNSMPRYIIERTVGPMSREALVVAGKKSNEILSRMPSVVWIKSYVSEIEGKI